MSHHPISFVIPAYNCAAHLPQAVESIINGNLEPGDEIIIVDDGSTDGTSNVIQGLAAAHSFIRTYSHHVNKGSAAAGRNTAIDHARTDLIFCLDSDNLLRPGTVAQLKTFMLDQNADAAAFGEIDYFGDNPAVVTQKWKFKDGQITLADALSGNTWPGPDGNYLFTVASWKKAGRYHESVGGGIDSWAFGIRQLATGTKMICLPRVSYLHRVGHDSAWMRDSRQGGVSLKALAVLLPFLDRLEPESVDYLFASETRGIWFDDLEKRPLKVKGESAGISGERVKQPPVSRSLMWRIRNKLAGIVAPK